MYFTGNCFNAYRFRPARRMALQRSQNQVKKHSFVEILVCSGGWGCSFLLIFNYCSIHSYGSSNSPQTRPQIFIVLGPRLTFARTFAFKEMAEPARRVASLL